MRSAFRFLTYLTLPVLTLHAEEVEPEEQSALPALKVLPVGSSVHDIRTPRFDDNYQKTSLLTAERMDILDKDRLEGKNVDLTLYKAGNTQASTHLNSAIYWHKAEILSSKENLTISSLRFDIASQGLTFQLQKQAGFLLGKTQTMFYSDRDQKMISPVVNKQNNKTSSRKTKKAAASAGVALATFPALLSAEELQQIDTFAAPATALIETAEKQATNEQQHIAEVSANLEHHKESLRAELSNTVGELTSTSTTTVTVAPQKNKVPVSITCDNGMYFDAAKSLIVYSDDIAVTHPKYTLTCEDELKVQFTENPAKKQAEPATTDDAGNGLALFKNLGETVQNGDVFVTAIATGNVIIKAKNNKGELIVAKAQTVSYNSESGVTVLRGGKPSVQQGDTAAILKSDSGYITISPNMSVRIHGAHEIKTTLKQLQNNPQ